MATTSQRTTTAHVWRDETTYPATMVAESDSKEALLKLRECWYAKRNPAGYGEALIRPTGDGRWMMRQSLSSD